MTYREARSLATLKAEIDRAAPKRSTASDGWIGDAAHASRTSDHNPWITRDGVGIVRARDFTHDPAGGLDCAVLAARLTRLLRKGAHPALGSGAYVIWRRRIISADRIGEGWRPYTGSNPHDKHLHLSVATAASGYDSTRPWNVMGARSATGRGRSGNRSPVVSAASMRRAFTRPWGLGPNATRGVRVIQRELARRGLYSGDVDGIPGDATKAALRAWQRRVGARRRDGLPTWYSLRVLAGILPVPQRRRFRVTR